MHVWLENNVLSWKLDINYYNLADELSNAYWLDFCQFVEINCKIKLSFSVAMNLFCDIWKCKCGWSCVDLTLSSF